MARKRVPGVKENLQKHGAVSSEARRFVEALIEKVTGKAVSISARSNNHNRGDLYDVVVGHEVFTALMTIQRRPEALVTALKTGLTSIFRIMAENGSWNTIYARVVRDGELTMYITLYTDEMGTPKAAEVLWLEGLRKAHREFGEGDTPVDDGLILGAGKLLPPTWRPRGKTTQPAAINPRRIEQICPGLKIICASTFSGSNSDTDLITMFHDPNWAVEAGKTRRWHEERRRAERRARRQRREEERAYDREAKAQGLPTGLLTFLPDLLAHGE